MATSSDVFSALRLVKYPGFSRDIVSFGIVRDVRVGDGVTTLVLAPPSGDPGLIERIRPEIERVVGAVEGVGRLEIATAEAPRTIQEARAPARPAGEASTHGHSHGPAHAHGPRGPQRIPGVARVIAVASGKGGVGKSTLATNLALALREHGRTGLLDADVYGPSTPLLLGVEGEQPEVTPERRITPIEAHGIPMISMGFFIEQERPVIWRGPMVTKLVTEFIHNVEWGALDYLVLDLPPGTGDVQLTLAQQLHMDGGVIVTTPQDVALADVRRGVRMFNQVNVGVLGVIENMSGFVCRHCGHETDIFGKGGGEEMARALGVPFLGRIALAAEIGERGDAGTPIVAADPEAPTSRQIRGIAAEIASAVARAA